jgi:flavin reductase (DIM6/NTAB) family NADH-FMN oxidoreductase RutF
VIDPDTYRSILGRFASGVTIVTARDADGGGRDFGMTVSAFSALSLDPPLVMACINHEASMFTLLKRAEHFGVSVLANDQEAASRHFADPDCHTFDGFAYTRAANGVVLLDGALAHLECRVTGHHTAGDHTIFIAAVERAVAVEGRPLLYYRGGYAQLER